jgi:inosine/xanthosine triphosphate pyrophosphatase family protein
MKLLIGTTNAGKTTEIRSALKSLELETVTPSDLGIVGEPDESFATLEENARSKARFYFAGSQGMPTIAEDTGLYVDALSNELGVKTPLGSRCARVGRRMARVLPRPHEK